MIGRLSMLPPDRVVLIARAEQPVAHLLPSVPFSARSSELSSRRRVDALDHLLRIGLVNRFLRHKGLFQRELLRRWLTRKSIGYLRSCIDTLAHCFLQEQPLNRAIAQQLDGGGTS